MDLKYIDMPGKKSLILMLLFITSTAQASGSDIFSYNQTAVDAQLSDLTALEAIIENGISDYNELSNALADPEGTFAMMAPQFSFEAGPFVLGLCCWPVGLFTHGLNKNKSDDDRISYAIGASIGVGYTIPLAVYGIYAGSCFFGFF